jgi:hypothetical protein
MMRIVLLVLAVALLATPAQAQRGPRKNGWYDAIGKTCPAVCRANGLFPACVGHDDSGRNQYACAGNPPRLSNYRGGATTGVGCALPGGSPSIWAVRYSCLCVIAPLDPAIPGQTCVGLGAGRLFRRKTHQ